MPRNHLRKLLGGRAAKVSAHIHRRKGRKGISVEPAVETIVYYWVLIQWFEKTPVLFSHGLNKALLVPDSRRATERNSNSINSWRHNWKRLERRLFQLFSHNLGVVLDFFLYYRITLNMKLMCTSCVTCYNTREKKNSLVYTFFKAWTNQFDICWPYIYIIYILALSDKTCNISRLKSSLYIIHIHNIGL